MHIQPDHSSYDPGHFSPWIPAVVRGETNAGTPLTAITAETDFSGLVNVTTAEGDKVTLNLAVETDYRYAPSGTRFPVGGAARATPDATVETSVAQSLGIAVEGDLSDQELADLAKLLQSITGIFRKYLQGHDEIAAARTARLAERFESLSLLSEVDLSVEMTRTLAVVQAAQDGIPAAASAGGTTETGSEPVAENPEGRSGRNWPGADMVTPKLEPFLPQVIRRAVDDLAPDADTESKRGRLASLRRGVDRALGREPTSTPAAVMAGTYFTREPAPPELSQVV